MDMHILLFIETANALNEPNAASEGQKRALELLDDSRFKSALT